MKKVIKVSIKIVAVIVLVIGVIGWLGSRPASAHNFDDYSLWSCAYTRQGAAQTIDHSWPLSLGNGWVEYGCRATGGIWGARCWRVTWFQPDNYIVRTSPYYYDNPCPIPGIR